MRVEQERKARRSKIIAISVFGVVILALIGVGVFLFMQDKANEEAYGTVAYGAQAEGVEPPAIADVQAPSTADDAGGIPVSNDGVGSAGDGDSVVTIYFDFMCPICAQFEATNAADLDALAAEDGVTVVCSRCRSWTASPTAPATRRVRQRGRGGGGRGPEQLVAVRHRASGALRGPARRGHRGSDRRGDRRHHHRESACRRTSRTRSPRRSTARSPPRTPTRSRPAPGAPSHRGSPPGTGSRTPTSPAGSRAPRPARRRPGLQRLGDPRSAQVGRRGPAGRPELNRPATTPRSTHTCGPGRRRRYAGCRPPP